MNQSSDQLEVVIVLHVTLQATLVNADKTRNSTALPALSRGCRKLTLNGYSIDNLGFMKGG